MAEPIQPNVVYQPRINFEPVSSEASDPIHFAASKGKKAGYLRTPWSFRPMKALPSNSNSRDPESSSKRALDPQDPVISEFTVIPGSSSLRAVNTQGSITSVFTVIDEGNTSSSLEPSNSIEDTRSRLQPWYSEIHHPPLVSQVTRCLTGTFQDRAACAIEFRFKIEPRLFAELFPIWPSYAEISINYSQYPAAGDKKLRPKVLRSFWNDSAVGGIRMMSAKGQQSIFDGDSTGSLANGEEGFRFIFYTRGGQRWLNQISSVQLATIVELSGPIQATIEVKLHRIRIRRIPKIQLENIDMIAIPWSINSPLIITPVPETEPIVLDDLRSLTDIDCLDLRPNNVSKDSLQILRESKEVPSGFIIPSDSSDSFLVKTRCRCNHIFKDLLPTTDANVARDFFRRMDRYDFFEPNSRENPPCVTDLLFGIKQIWGRPKPSDLNDKLRSRNTHIWPSKLHRNLYEEQRLGRKSRQGSVQSPSTLELAVGTNSNDRQSRTRPKTRSNALGNVRNDFICMAIGRPNNWQLSHVQFSVNRHGLPVDEKGLVVTDAYLFRKILETFNREIRRRWWFQQVLFPIKLSHVEYWEVKLRPTSSDSFFNRLQFRLYDNSSMAVELREGDKERLPDDRPEWRLHCPKDKWTFTSVTEVIDIKDRLSSQRLTHFIRDQCPMDSDLDYWAWIPRKLFEKLRRNDNEAHALGWGLAAYVEFNYITFLFHWVILTLFIAITLCLSLSLPRKGPLHGNVGSSIAAFLGPFAVLGIFYTVVYNYAKHRAFFR